MATFNTRTSPVLVYFGNENLQKGIYSVSYNGSYSASAGLPQEIALTRGTGSSVPNTRIGSKIISIRGNLVTKQDSGISKYTGDLQTLLKDYDSIFETDQWNYLRFVYKYGSVIPTNAITSWTASGDALNLNADTSRWQNPFLQSSIGFDINASSGTATLTYSAASGFDLSSLARTGNFEFALNLPDAYYITSVEFRIGSDSSNYYTYSFTTDYQGSTLHNGVNLLSIPWGDMTKVASPDNADIKYCQVNITINSTAENVYNCYLDNIFWVDEERARAFASYRKGEIKRAGDHWRNTFTEWECDFLNYTGYANSIHYYTNFEKSNVTGVIDTQIASFDGSLDPLPRIQIDIATATQINTLAIENINNSQSINLFATALADSDQIVFGDLDYESTQNGAIMDFEGTIPRYDLGKARPQLQIVGGSAYTVPDPVITRSADRTNAGDFVTPETFWVRQIAQSFTTVGSGVITSFTMDGYCMDNGTPGSPTYLGMFYRIVSDNAGDPSSTILGSGTLNLKVNGPTETVTVSGLNIAVATTTKYWITMTSYWQLGGSVWRELFWAYNSSSSAYTGGEAKYTTNSGSSWSAYTGDQVFTVNVSPVSNWRLDWSMKYKKRYLA